MKENTGFFMKVIFAHFFTYMVCGIIAMNLFNYQEWIAEQSNWRGMDDPIFMLFPVFQITRGILYGIVLLLLKDTIVYSKNGVLKLFLIIVILGIFNTPAPSPGSIEGIIYLLPDEQPLNIVIGGMMEILIQNFLFCIIVCTRWADRIKRKKI